MSILAEGIKKITSNQPGETVAIVVGTHGNEVAGIRAMNDLEREGLKIQRGTLYIIRGNPRAIAKGVRYVKENLNRCFIKRSRSRRSYEFKRAQDLKGVLSRCNIVLDVHATSIRDSKPFIVAENNSACITGCLPIQIVCRGFDAIEPGGIDYFMNKNGKVGICIESGYLDSRAAYQVAKKSIKKFLSIVGMRSGSNRHVRQLIIHSYFLYRSRTNRFSLARSFRNFEKVHRGQLIGHDGNLPIRAQKASYIIFAHNRNAIGEECFILAKKD